MHSDNPSLTYKNDEVKTNYPLSTDQSIANLLFIMIVKTI